MCYPSCVYSAGRIMSAMSANQALYNANPQSSIIEDEGKVIWYNWENGLNVTFSPNEIRQQTDGNGRLVQVENTGLKAEDIDFLKANAFILSEQRDMGYYRKALDDYLESVSKEARIILLPAGNRCNFRCRYCYEDHDDPAAYTDDDTDLISYFISKFSDRKLTLDFFGGEPLLKPKWILDLLSKTGRRIPASTTTNGYLLTRDLFSCLVEHGLRAYQITLDGLPDEHNRLRPLFNGKETWQKIYDNIKATKEVRRIFKIVIRVNFNERSLDLSRLDQFLDLFKFARDDMRYRFCFRAIDLYSDLNQTTNEECLENACSQETKFDLLTAFSAYAQKKGYLIADIGMYSRTGGLVCYASKPNSYVINGKKEILKCTVGLDQPVNKLSVLTRENIDNFTVEKASEEWNGRLNHIEQKCCSCPLFFQCMARTCAFQNITREKAVCPYILGKEKDLVPLILKDSEMCRKFQKKES